MLRRLLVLIALLIAIRPAGLGAAAPAGKVLVEICETGLPPKGEWPESTLVATEAYEEDVFGFFELPQKYITTGVRADRAFPTLVRATATVNIPAGEHRLLLRSRGAARLTLDGKQILATPFDQPRQFAVGNAGELPMEEQAAFLDLGPGNRLAPPGNREAWTRVTFSGRAPVTVRLETLVGGVEPKSKKPFRPELGETVVAIALAGSSTWHLLSAGPRRVPYTDRDWATYAEERRERIESMNTAARAGRREAAAPFWNRRRSAARAWLAATPEVTVPALPPGFPAQNAIDHFIGARLAQVKANDAPHRKNGGIDFFREIKPILELNCYRCHQGEKVKGGLRLDQREEARRGGKNDGPAVVPGQPAASALFRRITSAEAEDVMPAKGERLSRGEIELIRRWIEEGATWPDFAEQNFALTPLTDDLTFLRRVSLDTIGVIPSEAEITAFGNVRSAERRQHAIDRLLADPRWADHGTSYWLDVLAENPNLINPTLNNTGPFRWWIYESLLDNKPLDLFVTELVRMEGSERFGGPAGFGIASQNDAPMAAKGIILSSAFLGIEMKCARCHDAPNHAAKQRELFAMAAMLEMKPIKVAATSSVPLDPLRAGGREPLIEVTLAPGTTVLPAWPFAHLSDEVVAAKLSEQPTDSRDRLAALLTSPQNERFAQVMVNRLWEFFMGRGIVATVGDWEKSSASHPELLRWLGREFVRSGYDQKAIARLILRSHAYQRAVDPARQETSPLYHAPAARSIRAEQLVDSLFAATGKPFVVEPVNLDLDSVRTIDNALDLGRAKRAWMLASTSNERDRPSLVLPRIQAVAEVMEVFGWRGARPDAGPGVRVGGANVLQPALLANGTMMTWLTRLSEDHGLTRFALETQTLDQFIERLFLRFFTRRPSVPERIFYTAALQPGYATRVVAAAPAERAASAPHQKFVAWSNHMKSEANTLRLEQQAAARRGEIATPHLEAAWRQRCEDVVWALLNAPEWTSIL
jgi:Protein of unknown function (DUF1553)/Protein of unknown function (DUF1549)/Planctomycete cytochrome C